MLRIMNTLKIKTYCKKQKLSGEHFFILSKGNNAGKPLTVPCPNCFVFQASDKEEKDFYFWLIYCLWQGNYFRQFLYGSVIPFIRIHDLKEIIANATAIASGKKEKLSKTITLLKNLDEQQKTIQNQIILIKQAKVALMHNFLKE
jgi:hypothetical protein